MINPIVIVSNECTSHTNMLSAYIMRNINPLRNIETAKVRYLNEKPAGDAILASLEYKTVNKLNISMWKSIGYYYIS